MAAAHATRGWRSTQHGCIDAGRVRDIVFLTDGGISGAQRVYDLLAQHTDTRVHCMGIGHGAHR